VRPFKGRHKERESGTTPGNNVRFPGYDVLGQTPVWDETTKRVVMSRLDPPGSCHFFTEAEEATARALCDRYLAQDEDPRVPVVETIDGRLAAREFDGYRYEGLPSDDETWRIALHFLDEDAKGRFASPFNELDKDRQNELIAAVQQADEWHGLNAGHVWNVWSRYILPAFYSHPWAWNEIGFGGPAYPRGYKNRSADGLESWEEREAHPRDPLPWGEYIERVKGHDE
jgi:hypothetical protein